MSQNGIFRTFATCPPSGGADESVYCKRVRHVAWWSEQAGCEGILVYTDSGLVDPWLVAQIIIQNTQRLAPLVAVQPAYMHPYAVAKMVTTLAFLHGRRVYLNMVAGGFRNDLLALNDDTPHDRRYERLIEYTRIIQALLKDGQAVTFEGAHYIVRNLKLTPALPAALYPGFMISGSSEAGLGAARDIGAIAVQYPKPAAEYEALERDRNLAMGIRVGIIAREDSAEAWRIARERFPEDRKGQLTHQLAMKVSDSVWHHQLSDVGSQAVSDENPYWLVPFENYKTFCPYLVGSYRRVAVEVARYARVGYRTMILDVPASPEEMAHIGTVLQLAAAVPA